MTEHETHRSGAKAVRSSRGLPRLRRLTRSSVLCLAGILVAGSSIFAADEPGPAGQVVDECSAPLLGGQVVASGPDVTETALASRADGWSDGRWRRMARAPFAAAYGPAVWTGNRLVIMSPVEARTATYDPKRNRWREVAPAPRPTETFTPSLWTGTELVIVEVAPGFTSIGGLAYDPVADRWRELASLPFVATQRDHSLTGVAWTGTHIIVVESDGLVAALDVAADCWTELGRAPRDSVAQDIYLDGPRLLVQSDDIDVTSMRSFTPSTGIWSEPAVAPFEVAARDTSGFWVDRVLTFISWSESDRSNGVSSSFDPATLTWSRIEHDCRTPASRWVEADGLIVSSNGRRVLDPATFECTTVPKPPRRLNGTESTLWTGSELIAWGGSSESAPEPRGGSIYRPSSSDGE